MHIEESDKAKKKDDFFDLCPNDGINYYLTEQSDVLLLLEDYNTNQVLDTLICEIQPPGKYAYFWDNTSWTSGDYDIIAKINKSIEGFIRFRSNGAKREDMHCYYPAPFSPAGPLTEIYYECKDTCHVQLIIYDIHGEAIDTIFNNIQMPGYHDIVWWGEGHSSGVYFCRGRVCDSSFTQKLILVK
jgi:hypothetical protein